MSLFNRKNRSYLRSSPSTRKLGSSSLANGNGLPHLARQSSRIKRLRTRAAWLIGLCVFALLLSYVTAPYWLPSIRTVVPDRYIMAFLPEPIALMVFDIDVSELVPTPDSTADRAAALSLLATSTPQPTATLATSQGLTESSELAVSGYVQPTMVPIAPTPTTTPPPVAALSSAAVDSERVADLSRADAYLRGFTFHQQTGSNNCGPASIATMMSYWSIDTTMEKARAFLKPNANDPNVRPDEMVAYAESLGYLMIVRENGDFETIKRLILAGFPVMIETGYDPEPDTIGWTSHFLTLVGYSEQEGGFIAMDTYRRPNWFYPYSQLDEYWRQFNRRYMVAYRSEQHTAIGSIIGTDMDVVTNLNGALETAQVELGLDRSDPFGWFNLGTSLSMLGRYDEAALAFDEARRLGLPWRFLWYQFEPFETYLALGRYDDVNSLADAVIRKINTEEPYYYKALASIERGEFDLAEVYLTQALKLNTNYRAAQQLKESLGKQ